MSETNIYHIKFMHQDPEGTTTTIRIPADQISKDEIYNGEMVYVPTLRCISSKVSGSLKFELQEWEFLDLSKAFRITQSSAEVVRGDNQ